MGLESKNTIWLLYKGESSCMTAERQAALEKIGFEWSFYNDISWQTRYDELITFKQQHGHCNAPQSYAQNKQIGEWISNQRAFYKLLHQCKASLMAAERQAALEQIGFEWSLVNHSSWHTKYDELIIFKQQHGHCNVPQRFEDKKSLGLWVLNQRSQYRCKCDGKSSCMTAERQAALEKIGFESGLDHDIS